MKRPTSRLRLTVRLTCNAALPALLALLVIAPVCIKAALITVEAESGTLGTNFLTGNSSGTIYISNTNNSTTNTPGIPGLVASYNVTFPEAGSYDLYARMRVGAGAASDDRLMNRAATNTVNAFMGLNMGFILDGVVRLDMRNMLDSFT